MTLTFSLEIDCKRFSVTSGVDVGKNGRVGVGSGAGCSNVENAVRVEDDTSVEMKGKNCVLDSDGDAALDKLDNPRAVVLLGRRISVNISEKVWLEGLSVDSAALLISGIICSVDCKGRTVLASVKIAVGNKGNEKLVCIGVVRESSVSEGKGERSGGMKDIDGCGGGCADVRSVNTVEVVGDKS